MNDGLKQRIVGAIVLVALAVIFMPVLFDFEGERVVDTRSRIPAKPDIAPVDIPQPSRVEGIEAPARDDQLYQFEASREAAQQDTDRVETGAGAPALSGEGLPLSWVVQVGSYREKPKAKAFEERLVADGYKAFVRAGKSGDMTVHRVYIGPNIRQDAALQVKKAVDKKYGVKSLVLEFEP